MGAPPQNLITKPHNQQGHSPLIPTQTETASEPTKTHNPQTQHRHTDHSELNTEHTPSTQSGNTPPLPNEHLLTPLNTQLGHKNPSEPNMSAYTPQTQHRHLKPYVGKHTSQNPKQGHTPLRSNTGAQRHLKTNRDTQPSPNMGAHPSEPTLNIHTSDPTQTDRTPLRNQHGHTTLRTQHWHTHPSEKNMDIQPLDPTRAQHRNTHPLELTQTHNPLTQIGTLTSQKPTLANTPHRPTWAQTPRSHHRHTTQNQHRHGTLKTQQGHTHPSNKGAQHSEANMHTHTSELTLTQTPQT